MRGTAGSAAAPAARCKNLRRGSFILNLPPFTSFDHLVGAGEQRRWHFKAERLRSSEIDDQLHFRWHIIGEVAYLRSLKEPVNIACCASTYVININGIRCKAAQFCILGKGVNGG